MSANNKKGYLVVEAAIFLPIFILGVLTLMYLIKILWIQESVCRTFVDEARKVSVEAYISETYGSESISELTTTKIVNSNLFKMRMKSAIGKDGQHKINSVDVTDYKYMFSNNKMNSLISIDLICEIEPMMPIKFINMIEIKNSLLFRCWVGESGVTAPMGFEGMKSEEESKPVYIFPDSGKKYHSLSCGFVSVYPVKMILNQDVKKICPL